MGQNLRGVVVYGSLLVPLELREWLDGVENRASRVKVSGFERVFDAEAEQRETSGTRRAVLNLHEREESWFNGLLIPRLDPKEYEAYVTRETGYEFGEVDADRITPYVDEVATVDVDSDPIVAVNAPASNGIRPVPSYLKNCLKGASYWGSNFYDDFLDSTRLTSGRSLRSYVESTRKGRSRPGSKTKRPS